MNNFPKVIALVIAVSTACLTCVLQSGAQEPAPTKDQEKAQTESSVLIQPPANSNEVGETAVLPPPQQPVRERAAKQPSRLARRQPFMRPADPEPADSEPAEPGVAPPPAADEAMPAPETSEVVVQPTPRIVTDTDRGARRMYRSSGEVQLVMVVKNPGDGCFYEIPLCVPACCTGEPTVGEWCGLFGRGVVEYCWECGFTATVKFRHILGDVKVEYDG